MATTRIIGQPLPRLEGAGKVQGKTRYTADLTAPLMLWGRVLRSPYPHARIVRIDTTKARGMPGVHAVLTGRDLPNVRVGRRLRDVPVLARDTVRFIGDKVAAVAAETPEAAEEALLAIEVEYEELPAVFDPLEAMGDGAPALDEALSTFEGVVPVGEPALPGLHPPGVVEARQKNVYFHVSWSKGDVEEGFAQADHIFEHTFTVSRVHQAYLEPHSCLVQLERDGCVRVWASSKTPFMVRRQLAQAAGLPEERIVVEPTPVGGDFGGKGSFMDVPVAYHLARASGRPVKMVMSYLEELTAANPRHPAVVTIRSGVTRDGRLTARQARVVHNGGAYGGFTPLTTLPLTKDAGGVYRIPHARVDGYSVYTNSVPSGHFRGPGQAQVVFAVESHMDMIAHELGMDPVELRLRNLVREGDESPVGERWQGVRAEETLRQAAEAIGWGQPKARPTTGRGISVYEQHAIGGPTSGVLTLDRDGGFTWHTAIVDTGTGAHLTLRQILAEELRVALEQVRLATANTTGVPFEQGVSGSRVTHTAGQAALQAAQQMRRKLSAVAAAALGCGEDDVQVSDGVFSHQGRSVTLGELAVETPPEAATVTVQQVLHEATVTGFVAQAVEVEVDPETGQVRVLRAVSAHDVGTVLNPVAHQGQIDGAFVQALGYGTMEDLRVEEGRVATPTLGEYKIPCMKDVPPLTTVLLPSSPGQGPYQAKSIAEAAISGVAPAIANAVFDAVGVRVTELPVTAERVYRGLQARQGR